MVLALMNPLPYMQAVEKIKELSQSTPVKFNDVLLKLRKGS
jgi:hypothetical protein